MCIFPALNRVDYHTQSYSFQMNLSLFAASSFTAAQWVKLWRWICDWCTAAESHWVKVRPYLCSCSHFLTRQTFFVLIWHAVSFLVQRWNVSAAASQTLNCQLLLVGCKFRSQMIFHRKVKFLWFQCCLHASQTCFSIQPSSSSSQSSESVTCPLERHTVLHLCSRGAHGSTSPLKSVYYSFFCLCYFFTFDFNLDFLFSSCRTHFHSSVKLLLCCVDHLLSFTVWGSTRLCSYPLFNAVKTKDEPSCFTVAAHLYVLAAQTCSCFCDAPWTCTDMFVRSTAKYNN